MKPMMGAGPAQPGKLCDAQAWLALLLRLALTRPPPVCSPATRVLVLKEMITEQDLVDDKVRGPFPPISRSPSPVVNSSFLPRFLQEYKEIVEDIEHECSKYG